MPYIQTYSQASDRVMYIDHTQPYGGDGDSYVEIIFYTGRPFTSAKCREAAEKVTQIAPEWIITSGDTPGEFLSATILAKYPFRLKAGNQYLLGTHVPQETKDGAFDLTPLYRELKASVRDEPPELPRNQFYRY